MNNNMIIRLDRHNLKQNSTDIKGFFKHMLIGLSRSKKEIIHAGNYIIVSCLR